MVKSFNIFKVEYSWYEGEHEETLLGKEVERDEFERDIIKAKKFAESLLGKVIEKGEYLGKGYRVNCLPEYYAQIVWFLTERLGYIICYSDEEIDYSVDDLSNRKIEINKSERKIKRSVLIC